MKNLARLLGQATPLRLDGPYYGSAMDMDASAALIAAAPQMADLLIACEKARRYPCSCGHDELMKARARLADFDKELT